MNSDFANRRTPQPLGLDLLMDFRTLGVHLKRCLAEGDFLNAYLLAAGMEQVAADFLGADSFSLRLISTRLRAYPGRRVWATGAARFAAAVAGAVRIAHVNSPRYRRVSAWTAEFTGLVSELASALVEKRPARPLNDKTAWPVLDHAELLPSGLQCAVVKVPRCFHSFDQTPGDCRRLALGFAQRWSNRDRAVTVVGVRTSGSYLAPLIAAELRAAGYRQVETASIRPGQPLATHERRTLQRSRALRAMVVLTDDPPQTGSSIAATIDQLLRLGLRQDQLVLLLPLLGGSESVPASLAANESVLLPWEEWSIHASLQEDSIAEGLKAILLGRDGPLQSGNPSVRVSPAAEVFVVPVPVSQGDAADRGHMSRVYRVTLTGEEAPSSSTELLVRAEWTGLGYFAEHRAIISRRLAGHLPVIYGTRAGVMYREWISEKRRLGQLEGHTEEIVAYFGSRARELTVSEDMSFRLVGRAAAWELVAQLIGQAFGRFWPANRALAHAVAKRLLKVSQPSVLDGRAGLTRWFLVQNTEGGPRAVKTAFGAGAFTKVDAACYDPLYDLSVLTSDWAAVAVDEGRAAEADAHLFDPYSRITGTTPLPEPWLLYRLLRLVRHRQFLDDLIRGLSTNGLTSTQRAIAEAEWGLTELSMKAALRRRWAVERAMASCVQEFVAGAYLGDLEVSNNGPFCSIDIDGVLEGTWLSVPVIGPLGGLALRSLIAHGWRPLLASGRSAEQVAERCHAYGLPGGIAEYGAVTYDAQGRSFQSLVNREDGSLMELIRASLKSRPELFVEPGWQQAIRAGRIGADGKLRPLIGAEQLSAIATAGELADSKIRVVVGRQSDFTFAANDKADALLHLMSARGNGAGAERLEFAVGDSLPDLGMLMLARRAFSPASVEGCLTEQFARSGKRLEVTRRPYASGLFQATKAVIGHRPGSCRSCAPGPLSPNTAMLLSVLGAREGGRGHVATQLATVAMELPHRS